MEFQLVGIWEWGGRKKKEGRRRVRDLSGTKKGTSDKGKRHLLYDIGTAVQVMRDMKGKREDNLFLCFETTTKLLDAI